MDTGSVSHFTRKHRTFVVVYPAHEDRRCRTCRNMIEVGMSVWSPYFGGGQYHLSCEATVANLPPAAPDPTCRCECGWFKYRADQEVCQRCYRLRLVEEVLVS